MDMRELKGLEIAARQRIVREGDGVYTVPSQASAAKYRVTLRPAVSCTCEDFQLRQEKCKHILAAEIVREKGGGEKGPEFNTNEVPKRKTYSQNWPAYNLAQREEKHRFRVLLRDPCAGLHEPTRYGVRGRRPHTMADRLFAVCFKVYSTFSSSRFGSDLADAYEEGYLTASLCVNKVNVILETPEITPYLHDLITQSSLPLRVIETAFAVDSSGFSVSKFVRWFDEKYGRERSGKDWVKVHLCVGVKTGVVTGAAIYDRDANDCPILPELVRATAQQFNVKEVSADKGYLSAENVEAIVAAGGRRSSRQSRTRRAASAACSSACSTTTSTATKSSWPITIKGATSNPFSLPSSGNSATTCARGAIRPRSTRRWQSWSATTCAPSS